MMFLKRIHQLLPPWAWAMKMGLHGSLLASATVAVGTHASHGRRRDLRSRRLLRCVLVALTISAPIAI